MVAKNEGVKTTADVLKGMNAISDFANTAPSILLRWLKEYPKMPMRKVGGVYMADPDRLRQFLKDLAAGKTENYVKV